jgi:hypothetical protein
MNRWLPAVMIWCSGGLLSAADLGAEFSAWGPLATGSAPISDGAWFGGALAFGSVGDRFDGMFIVERSSGIDVQITGGFAYDRSHWERNEIFSLYNSDWARTYVRGGTDPLADDAGSPFGVVGGAICLPFCLSFQGEVGYSHERDLLARGEASLLFLRIALEHDGQVESIRIGSGPRILGTTGPLAGGILADWVRSYGEQSGETIREEGGIFQVFGFWRPLNHLVIGADLQVAAGAVERDQPREPERTVATAALSLGVIF